MIYSTTTMQVATGNVMDMNSLGLGDTTRGKVIGTCHFENKCGAIIPCQYLKN